MTEPPEHADWDETVDVLCVGEGPGALAYGIFCAASDLDVLIVESPELDQQTLEWRHAMTSDLVGFSADPNLSLVHAEPVAAEEINDRSMLEPFVGEHLRQWSGSCLGSPFGLLTSHVPDLDMMRTTGGGSIVAGVVGSYRCDAAQPGPALVGWLRERAEGLFGPAGDRLDGLVIKDGRIAGVVLATADGPCRIATTNGLAISLGGAPRSWPDQTELAGLAVDVAVIGRQAGRFLTVGLLAR